MKVIDFQTAIVVPALNFMGGAFVSNAAARMLVAIAMQESGLNARIQFGGPARGFWQFEKGGGVRGVLSHPATRLHARDVCLRLAYPASEELVYDSIADNDILACCFARLLLWSDPHPMPVTSTEGWAYYLRNWRPGKPDALRWPAAWEMAG